MADLSNTKDITTVDSIPSVAITDKIYINKGGKLQQVSLATAIESKIDSSLSKSKFAADAKATKDAISKVDSDIKAQNPISETIFSNTVTFSPTAYGNAIPEQIEGYIKQDTTKGLQLFDASCLSASKTQGGATVVNNGDGSFTVSGDGNLTENFSMSYNLSHEDSLKLFPVGTYQITRKQIRPSFFIQIREGRQHTISSISKPGDVLSILEEDTQNPDYYIQFLFYGNAIDTIKPGTIKPMAWASAEVPQDEDWEPYTGGQPSPNPDYPQIVHGVGDMGFFDGELLQGYYQVSDGTFKPATVALCNKNPIPCKPGDKIIFEYEDVINGSGISIFFYKSDGTFISRVNKVGVRKIEGVAPQDTTYCNIVINPASEPIPVASAKHITVTINDKYAVCVKSKGKNLLDFEGFLNSRGSQYTKCGDRYRITGTGSAYSNPILLSDEDEDFTLTGSVTSESGNGYSVQLLNNAGNVVAFIRDDTKKPSGKGCKIRLNYVGAGAGVYEDIMVEKGTSHDKYIPYQSTTTYIPVDYPLFEGDKIVRSNGEYKLLRKWGMETFDGSVVWGKNSASEDDYLYYYSKLPEKDTSGKLYCDCLKHIKSTDPGIGVQLSLYYPKALYVRLSANELPMNDIEHFSEWIQEHPLTFVYPLATPTEEPLSSEAMKALYSIMACDEETELTIVGVPSDAEIQNQFLLPRNEDGALNTTAYCTAKRNEIALEELENATAARLSALETQALQEV